MISSWHWSETDARLTLSGNLSDVDKNFRSCLHKLRKTYATSPQRAQLTIDMRALTRLNSGAKYHLYQCVSNLSDLQATVSIHACDDDCIQTEMIAVCQQLKSDICLHFY